MHLNGENSQNVSWREKLEGSGQMDRFMIVKNLDPGTGLPPSRDNIHVYYHTIPRSSETAWPIKVKFDMKHL